MADSHDGEKSQEESFHEQIEFTSTHKLLQIKPNATKKWIAFCTTGVAVWVLGFFISFHWWTHEALLPSILEVAAAAALATIILLCFFLVLGVVYLIAAGFGYGPLKPKNGGPTNVLRLADDKVPQLGRRACHPDAPADVSVSLKKDDFFIETIYPIGILVTAFITFVVSWVYCIATYGFLFGVGLGWLPSFIVAVIVGYLWPLILIGIVLLFASFNK